MGKGGDTIASNNTSSNVIADVKKISLEELSNHRTPDDGKMNYILL